MDFPLFLDSYWVGHLVLNRTELWKVVRGLEARLVRDEHFLNTLFFGACPVEASVQASMHHVFNLRLHPNSPVVTIPHFGHGAAFTGPLLRDSIVPIFGTVYR